MPSPLTTLPLMLEPDPTRTVIRPFAMSYPDAFAGNREPRQLVIARRLLALPEPEQARIATTLTGTMSERHRNADAVFRRRYLELDEDIRALPADERQQLLLGALFSQEYAFESAALFNPSIIADPEDLSNGGDTRFVVSLRGIGEGHISSVTFRTGNWREDGYVTVDAASDQAVPPRIGRNVDGGGAELVCCDSADVSETVIFPVLPSQRQGVEDLRLTLFSEGGNARPQVIGTYTAFDGRTAGCELLHGIDFRTVEMRPLTGAMAGYKGMALFPRRIDGRYAMLGRQDGENIWLLRSDDLYRWEEGEIIMRPRFAWETVQLGNCGSPLEIDEGWLVFTHGVGFVRSYCIGACLLDKDDPCKVLRRTPEPLLVPELSQRGGYVPNVVYGCGALLRGRDLLVPYAVGDRHTTFATGTVDGVLAAMVPADDG